MNISFRLLDTDEIGRAHAWHSGFAAANDVIYPRDEATFIEMVRERQCWCAISHEDEILGLSYVYVNPPQSEVEIGGLMVAAKTRGKGIGDYLFRLPLIHFLVNEQPHLWQPQPTVVAHVLNGNDKPGSIIAQTGFVLHGPVRKPGHELPGLRTEQDGHVHGQEYHLPLTDSYDGLADWLDTRTGFLRDGTVCSVGLLPGETLQLWGKVLRDMHAHWVQSVGTADRTAVSGH